MFKLSLLFAATLSFATFTTADSNTQDHWLEVQIAVGMQANHPYMTRSMWRFSAPQTISDTATIFIDGDATEDIAGAQLIHIAGELNADLHPHNHAEIIIGKNVSQDATIFLNDISQVYVHGDFNGTIRATSSLEIVINGSFNGYIYYGAPATRITVNQNFNGNVIASNDRGSLLDIKVQGFTDFNAIQALFDTAPHTFKGTFNHSNGPRGIVGNKYYNYFTIANTSSPRN